MHEHLIKQLRLKITALVFLKNIINSLGISGLFVGLIVLVLRVGFLVNGPVLILTFICLLPGIILAITQTLKQIPSVSHLYAYLDSHNTCGGLLMTYHELNIKSHDADLPVIDMPLIKWRFLKSAAIFAAALIFVVTGFIVPQKSTDINLLNTLDVRDDTERLKTQVDILRKQKLLPDEKVVKLIKRIDKLSEKASGKDPVKTWEALDHIQQNIKKTAEKAAGTAQKTKEELTQAQMLAQGLSKKSGDLNPDLFSKAMKELDKMTQSLLAENKLSKDSSFGKQNKSGKNIIMDKKLLNDLVSSIEKEKTRLTNQMKSLGKANMLDIKKITMGKKKKKGTPMGLMQFLKKNSGNAKLTDAVSKYFKNPSRGEAGRGRADASMMWTKNTNKEGVSFKDEFLSSSAIDSLKKSRLMGMSKGAYVFEKKEGVTQYSALNPAMSGSGQAIKHTILPRHTGVVKRYFER